MPRLCREHKELVASFSFHHHFDRAPLLQHSRPQDAFQPSRTEVRRTVREGHQARFPRCDSNVEGRFSTVKFTASLGAAGTVLRKQENGEVIVERCGKEIF
jgi:hypothetical protein